MITTRFTQLLGVDHPVASAGMGGGATGGELVAAVSEAGGLGVLGASFLPPDEVASQVRLARELTAKPLGINLLLHATEERVEEVLALEPEVFSTAWARDDQDLAAIFAEAHEHGSRVMHMVPHVDDAVRAVEAGADVIVAQGNEGVAGQKYQAGPALADTSRKLRQRKRTVWKRTDSGAEVLNGNSG